MSPPDRMATRLSGRTGRAVVVALVAVAVLLGGLMYWLQVYAFYHEAPEEPVLLVARATTTAEPIAVEEFRAIDSDSAPVRYRSCFRTPQALPDLAARYAPYPTAEPLNAPRWFDCFDAAAIGAALESGEAQAFLSVPEIRYGIDRVVAILPDGRGFAWQQINACGRVVFDGDPPPAGCPPLPEEES
jgi:hypothetical protein